jgi:Arc/MetJ-type ribon-helix-helix transcriptional regulator
MTITVSKDVESSINAAVQSGQFASPDEMITKLVREYAQRAQQQPAAIPPALTDEESADQELQRRLFDAGLLSEIKPPRRVSTGTERFTPVPIQGEPLSETVIRERR